MPRPRNEAPSSASTSGTLRKGIHVLLAVVHADAPVSVEDLADQLGLTRSVAYRLVRTLEEERLVRRTSRYRYEPSLELAALGSRATRPLVTVSLPYLRELADSLGVTAYVAVREGDEIVTLCVEEPRTPRVLAYRPSVRHQFGPGSTSIALLAGNPPHEDDSGVVLEARRVGYAISEGEVIPGLTAVSAPISTSAGECLGIVSVVLLRQDEDLTQIGKRVLLAAQLVARSFD